jgi:hypothetical protein
MDLFILYYDPRQASIVLGVILAAALILYGAFAFWLKYREKTK